MRSRASGGSWGDSVAATSAPTMSSLRRRAICTLRAMSIARSSTGGRARARTTAPGVAGIDEQAQPREHVLDLGALEERGRAGQAVGHRALLERHGDGLALVAHRAHEHPDLLGRHARSARAARSRPPCPGPARARWRSARSARRRRAGASAALSMRPSIGSTTA
jgi:hypothetical protein